MYAQSELNPHWVPCTRGLVPDSVLKLIKVGKVGFKP